MLRPLRRPLRRPLATLAPLLLVSSLVAACGSDESGPTGFEDRLDAVSISGDFGASPEVEWTSQMSADGPESEDLVEGDGEAVAAGDQILMNLYVGNGFTRETSLDTFTDQPIATTLEVGGEPPQPQDTSDPAAVTTYLLEAFALEQVEAGDTVGTRKVVTASSADIVGFSGFELGIGNEDALLFVIDLAAVVPDAPSGTDQTPEAWVPDVTMKGGQPSALDFTGTPPPADFLRVGTLVEGEGEPVEEGDLVAVHYLGQTYDGDEPFDANFESPLVLRVGAGGVIKGWDQGLQGVPAGSRIMLAVPPRLGYGQDGRPDGGIGGDDTLYFVIDVLAAG